MVPFRSKTNPSLLVRFVLLVGVFSILTFSPVNAQDDTRNFQIYTPNLINRITFTYSTQIDEDAVWNFVPASRDFRTPTGPIPECWEITFQTYTDASGWVPTDKTIHVYPTVTFPAGVDYPYTSELANLQTVLAARPDLPNSPLPMLPTVTATQLFRAQVQYLEFSDGAGIRYITAVGLDKSPLSNPVVFYTFQGLTNDGAYYVAAQFPLDISVLPDEAPTMTTEEYDAFAADYDHYLSELTAHLDALEPAAFDPDLIVIDNLFRSLDIHGPTATILTPERTEIASANYENISFTYDSRLASRIEVDIVPPFEDDDHMTMFGSEPGYTVFSLFDFPVLAANMHAQFRVIPVKTFPASDTISDQQLAELRTFLAERSPLSADTSASGAQPIPILPPINAAQLIVAKPTYLDFHNGTGVRFVSTYSQGIAPITNPLFYQFMGITSDGEYVVSVLFPISTAALPDVDYNTFNYDAFAVQYPQYVERTLSSLDGLDTGAYMPDLALLDDFIRSIALED